MHQQQPSPLQRIIRTIISNVGNSGTSPITLTLKRQAQAQWKLNDAVDEYYNTALEVAGFSTIGQPSLNFLATPEMLQLQRGTRTESKFNVQHTDSVGGMTPEHISTIAVGLKNIIDDKRTIGKIGFSVDPKLPETDITPGESGCGLTMYGLNKVFSVQLLEQPIDGSVTKLGISAHDGSSVAFRKITWIVCSFKNGKWQYVGADVTSPQWNEYRFSFETKPPAEGEVELIIS